MHTLRNLPEMVRNMDHIIGRMDEAATYGHLDATMASRLGVNLAASHHDASQPPTRAKATTESSLSARQVWLAGYLIKVNGGLAAWGHRCLPTQQLTYLATMRLARCSSDECSTSVTRDLSHALRLIMLKRSLASAAVPPPWPLRAHSPGTWLLGPLETSL